MNELESGNIDVKLIGYTQNSDNYNISQDPDKIALAGALGCFEQKPSAELYQKMKSTRNDYFNKKAGRVFKRSIGRGHGSILDQAHFTYSIENLPRSATLQLCLPEYLEHLQQSMRRVTAERGCYIPKILDKSEFSDVKKKAKRGVDLAFETYNELVNHGIPAEDARYVIPLNAKTNIQTTGNVRELQHLHGMNTQGEVPMVIRDIVEEMISLGGEKAPQIFEDRRKNYETLGWIPSSQLYSYENESLNKLINKNDTSKTVLLGYNNSYDLDLETMEEAVWGRNEAELSNLKHIHFDFMTPMSLACFHQATRQRTWNHSIESIYDAAERRYLKIPPKIENKELTQEYMIAADTLIQAYDNLINEGVPRSEAIGFVPHGLMVYDWIHVNGWNAIHSIGKRRCKTAQWEIRDIADDMSEFIKEKNPALGTFAEPQGFVYQICPEESKTCKICENKLREYLDGR